MRSCCGFVSRVICTKECLRKEGKLPHNAIRSILNLRILFSWSWLWTQTPRCWYPHVTYSGRGSTGALGWLCIRQMVVRTRNGILCFTGEQNFFSPLLAFQEGSWYVKKFVWYWLFCFVFLMVNLSVFQPARSNCCELKSCRVSPILIV